MLIMLLPEESTETLSGLNIVQHRSKVHHVPCRWVGPPVGDRVYRVENTANKSAIWSGADMFDD